MEILKGSDDMRLPNGYGGIRKLKGNRRRPYQVVVTVGWEVAGDKVKQKQKTIGYASTKKEALTMLADYNVNPIDVDKSKVTFAEVWGKWLPTQDGKSDSKQRQLGTVYKKSEKLYNVPLSTITLPQLQSVVEDSAKSRSYRQQFIIAYRSLFDYAYRYGYIKNDISKMLVNNAPTNKPKVNIFSYDEYEKMPRQYDLFFYTGLRVGEMLDLRAEDVQNDVIHVRGTKTANSERFVPLHPTIKDLIPTKGKVWHYENCYTKLLNAMQEYCNHTPHDMRKTFATVCYLSGIDDVIIKRLMGHAVKDITHSTYIRNSDLNILENAICMIDYNVLKTMQGV
jgi:integrase